MSIDLFYTSDFLKCLLPSVILGNRLLENQSVSREGPSSGIHKAGQEAEDHQKAPSKEWCLRMSIFILV